MDEKADVTPPEDEMPAAVAATDTDAITSAGNSSDDILTTGTDSLISTEIVASTETDTLTQTLTTTTESTTTSTITIESSASETSTTNISAPIDSFISSDALSVADALTSVDDLRSAEELTSENVKASANNVMNKVSSIDTVSTSPVCQLEEELKRLHEGDPPEDAKVENTLPEPEKTPNVEKSELETKLPKPVSTSQPTNKPVVELTKIEVNPEEMLAADNVSKDPALITKAQEDFKYLDVLVCGRCHEVFHFVEDFQLHKSGVPCNDKSHLVTTCDGESKPQVWGFTLWKHKQHKLLKESDNVPSSWAVYQKWCKLPQADKDAWITAGQTIQFCSKISTAKIAETKSKVVSPTKQVEKDPLALDGFAESNKENSIVGNVDTKPSDVIKKTIVKPVRLNNDVTILPSSKSSGDANSNKALRTVRSTEKREYVVERIVAKRFNPKRKTWEYQIKWENFSSDQNTWEPLSNLNHCKQMVEEFEEQLKKLKAEKAKQQAAGLVAKGRGRPLKPSPTISTPSSSFSNDSTPGRPTRTSKQKALNQVKAWCGNISDTDEGGVKRSFEDDDSDDSFEKKMKYEDYSDDSDVDIKPRLTQFKKIAPKPIQAPVQIIKNGIGAISPLPQNVLIPDANGVVRINQKQLPSLSTGVYIMSKTAGIIKLDSTTSKVATSGGQTIVKVAPKIGQTQIKIVKKDGQTTTTKQIIQMTPNRSTVSTPTKTFKPVITKVKKAPEISPKVTITPKATPTPTKIIVKPKEEPKKQPPPPPPPKDDESDDGLEELPFPDEIKLPEPESPPGEFILDPITGKIAGREYPDPEPEPIPEPEEEEEEEEESKIEAEDSSLENIVKLAAADITEDDLKTEETSSMETDEVTSAIREEHTQKKTEQTVPPIVSTQRTPVKVTMTPTLVKSSPSILNKALSSSNILRKSLLTSPPQPKIQQRILNPSITPRSHVGSIMRASPRSASLIRTRPMAPKPKFNIATSSGIIKSQHEISPRNVYSKTTISGVTRKIGNTTIRSTAGGFSQRPVARIVQTGTNVHRVSVSPRKEPVMIRQVVERAPVVSKPKTVISMPSLIGDDESVPSPPPVAEVTKSPTPPAPSLPSATASPVADTPPTLTPTPPAETPVEAPIEPVTEAGANNVTTDISSFTLTDNENPIFITGDDGTVYQVAGQNEHGQTILLTQGSDGQQQCLLVTNEVAETMDTSEDAQADIAMPEIPTNVTEPLSVKTDEDVSDQVVAQVVRAEPPSPGGTHKVVVMLPDGNLMVTQVSPEEYASLELE